MDEFDAIAIGGGLAGAAFAIELARNGRRVAIVERTAAPTLKVCGDFLSREAHALLSYLGVDAVALGATRIRTLRLRSGRQVACAELPFPAAGISRLLLDETLLQQAQALTWIEKQSQSVGDLLQGARFLSDRPAAITAIPYGYMRYSAVAPNVFPLGDQLCVIPSFTGDGTSLALSSGVAAAQAVIAGRTAEAFQRSFLHRVRGQFFWARAVEAAFKSAPLRALSIGAVGAMPKLAGLAVNLTRVKDVADIICPPSAGVTAPAR